MTIASSLGIEALCATLSAPTKQHGRSVVVRRLWLAGVCLTLALLQPAAAHAEVTDAEAAGQLFDDARALMEDGQYTRACPKLEASQRLDPQLGTLLHLGHCYEKSAQLQAAYRTFLAAAELAARKTQQGKPEPREKLARERAESLATRLSLLEVQPSDPTPDLAITLDGAAIDRAQWNQAIAVEPGDHVLRASAAGRSSWQQAFTIGTPARLGISIPVLAAESVKPAQAALAPAPVAAVSYAPLPRASTGAPLQRIIGYVALGAGVAGLGLGTAFGIMRSARLSQLESDCNLDSGRCSIARGDDAARARIESLHDQASAFASGANLAWIIGGLAAVGGVVLILTGPREDTSPAVTLGISPGALSLTAHTDAL